MPPPHGPPWPRPWRGRRRSPPAADRSLPAPPSGPNRRPSVPRARDGHAPGFRETPAPPPPPPAVSRLPPPPGEPFHRVCQRLRGRSRLVTQFPRSLGVGDPHFLLGQAHRFRGDARRRPGEARPRSEERRVG